MPITHLPVVPRPIEKLWKERVAAPKTWGNAVEKLRSRQIDLKQRAAAAKVCRLDEGGQEHPQQRGGSCGTGSSSGLVERHTLACHSFNASR
jgi:hypothetical protein